MTLTVAAEAAPSDPHKRTSSKSPHFRSDDGDPSPNAGLGTQVREDRCLVGGLLNRGGTETKATAEKLLTGSENDLHEAVKGGLWSYGGPLREASFRDEDQINSYVKVWDSQYDDWAKTVEPFRKTYLEQNDLYRAPEFGDPIRKYLIEYIPFQYSRPEESAAAKEQAQKVSEGLDEYAKKIYFLLGAGSGPGDYRAFIERGGYLQKAPDEGTVEFRTEAEALKMRWAACDVGTPFDPYKVMGPVIGAAHQEWQAELAGQAKSRTAIVNSQIQTVRDMRTATDAMVKASGQAWIANSILTWQKYQQEQRRHGNSVPPASLFRQADATLKQAKTQAGAEAKRAGQAAASAKAEAGKVSAAQDEAARAADAAGAPRGRGLEYAQQAAQIAKASAAATEASSKAALTASKATNATVGDSKTLASLAETQAHAVQAEYHRAAAEEAASQAKAAADSAGRQAEEAKANAAKATAAKATAEKAETTARDAAKDASEKRAIAEKERENARKYRADADAQRNKAAEADKRAQEQKTVAADARGRADGAGRTAAEKATAAEDAEDRATLARQNAEEAARRQNAAVSRSKALEAAAAAAEGTDAAKDARSAANDAKADAAEATDAAAKARTAADEATDAAVAARADAVKANGSAQRARAASNGAAADAATTRGAVATAHAAAADAIEASEQAAKNVRNAEKEAKKAAEQAAKARTEANSAQDEAKKAAATSAETAGHAYATAQAAADARDAAAAVAKPADIAIGLGSPYRESDSSAGLAVIVGQTSKSLAEQQAAAAKAKADEAARAAKQARELAAKAAKDAKAAAEAAAKGAEDAARAARYLSEARGYAAQATDAAAAALRAEANAKKYNEQANNDAFAADGAATGAESDAAAARNSADDAEKDAGSARSAATSAESDASAARGSADRADKYATAAEGSAANARDEAVKANAAATKAEADERARQEAERKKAMETGVVGVPGGAGAEPGADDEALLLKACGQTCVDDYRAAYKAASMSVVDWVKENGADVLLEVLGVKNVQRCFGQGDVESCLWGLVDVAGYFTIFLKFKSVVSAIAKVGSGISHFFERAEWGKRTLDRLRKVVEKAKAEKPAPERPPGCLKAGNGARAMHGGNRKSAANVDPCGEVTFPHSGDRAKLGSDGKYHLNEGDRNSKIENPADFSDTITDIDVIDGGVLWEEKDATDPRINPENWVNKHVGKKVASYLRARQYIKDYETAPIGFWFEKRGTSQELRRLVEQRVQELRGEYPEVKILVRWTD